MRKFDSDKLELILFSVDQKILAVETRFLIEVLEVSHVSPLPFVPSYLEGLINVNGQIIPQIDFSSLVYGEQQSDSDAINTLIVVNVENQDLALRVGLVQEPVTIDVESIKPIKKSKKKKADKNTEYLLGSFEHNEKTIDLFDAGLLKGLIRSDEQSKGKQGFLGHATDSKEEIEEFVEFLLVKVDEQDYAIHLNDVVEIIELPSIKSQPRAPELITGIGLIRETPRLIVDLSAIINGHRSNIENSDSVVIVEHKDVYCGFNISELLGLESIKKSQIRTGADENDLTIVSEKDDRLIRILHMPSIFTEEICDEITPYMPDIKQSVQEIKLKQFEILRFFIGEDAFGIFVDDIRRVVSGKSVEKLLTEHQFIMGTMELEGKVVPVINLLTQLGYTDEGKEMAESTVREYVVVNDGEEDWGLAILNTDQIVQVDETRLEKVASKGNNFVTSFANYEGELITILNPKLLCEENHDRELVKA